MKEEKEGGTYKQKTVRNHKGDQGHAKLQMAERKREEHPTQNGYKSQV